MDSPLLTAAVLLLALTTTAGAFQGCTLVQSAYPFRAGHCAFADLSGLRQGQLASRRVFTHVMLANENGEKYRNKVVELLGALLPTAQRQKMSSPIDEIDFAVAKKTGMTAEEMAQALETGLSSREWFVTGRVLPELFSDRFAFQDPDVKLKGIENYASESMPLLDAEKFYCPSTRPDATFAQMHMRVTQL